MIRKSLLDERIEAVQARRDRRRAEKARRREYDAIRQRLVVQAKLHAATIAAPSVKPPLAMDLFLNWRKAIELREFRTAGIYLTALEALANERRKDGEEPTSQPETS
jgi:hypothetical protein